LVGSLRGSVEDASRHSIARAALRKLSAQSNPAISCSS
jgi:hypothetical protein